MQECVNCQRLRERIADLNSELLVLKIAAFEAGYAAGKHPSKTNGGKAPRPDRKRNGHAVAGDAN